MTTMKWAMCVLAVVGTVLLSHFYMVYWADTVAESTNYFVALAVLPVLVGSVLGGATAAVVATASEAHFRDLLFIPITCALATLALTGLTLFFM